MAEVMLSNGNDRSLVKNSTKSGVKTLSIIDTISELATDKTEASRLTLPSPIRLLKSNPNVPPRHPKVSVPLTSPQQSFNGAKPRFLSSSPKKMSPIKSAILNNNNQRGQTPDWIRDIFHHAKRGHREKLEMTTRGLEPTLIRNLTDHMGNNLLHCVCSAGHTSLLPFLTSRFANELSGALNDENRKGLNPVQSAIKLGKLEIVQWLVRHSSLRDKLTSRDGERSLLHQAAKYGQEELVSWLAEEMSHGGLDVDQLDIAANSPLHLAAKRGSATSASELLHHGAQITLKNDMGLKPYDCAKVMGQKECAEFLLLYETSVEMAKELSEVHTKKEMLMAEHNELRSYFKEVLTIGKRLAREREEMCRELRRLHEFSLELHDKMIMADARQDILQASNALQEKWQLNSRQFLTPHHEAEHKLWIVEESWRKNKTGSSGPSSLQDFLYPQRHLRDRLEDIKGRSLALPSSTGIAALASSDEDEEVNENDYEDVDNSRILTNIAQRKKLATPAPSTNNNPDESLYSSVSNEVLYSKISSNDSNSGLFSPQNHTASVIEVIEPTASEEEEFKEALKEMNWSSELARPAQIRSSTSSKSSRYSEELSPTKRLMEMGIKMKKSKRSPIGMYANIDFENELEEHILPENFDDDSCQTNNKNGTGEKSSVSPSSRKSASSHASRGSQDSGIGIQHQNGQVSVTVNVKNRSKAWYDVPSEDETEAPEADSLASIISHRGSSDDET